MSLPAAKTRMSVSMKSGLEGRNNSEAHADHVHIYLVSMKSGLDGRNNIEEIRLLRATVSCLNEVRPRWPEQ